MSASPSHPRPFVANRLQVLQALQGLELPASRSELLHRARANGADEATLFALEHLPDRRFGTPEEIAEAVGGDVPSSGMQGGAPHAGEPQAEQARPAPPSDATQSVDPPPGADRL
jgi:hypothetical protein